MTRRLAGYGDKIPV